MGGRGSSSSQLKWDWKNEANLGDIKLVNKYPIGKENEKMYRDTVKNLTSIFPILDVKDVEPVTIKTKNISGVAIVGIETKYIDEDYVLMTPEIVLGFDDKLFATHNGLSEHIEQQFDLKYLSTNKNNHIVVHELAHMLDYQLSIKRTHNISLNEFLQPKQVNKKDAIKEHDRLMTAFDKKNRFSTHFPKMLQKELGDNPDEIINQVSRYSGEKPAEFFAEAFTKWYLSKNKNGRFEKAFEKTLFNEVNKL